MPPDKRSKPAPPTYQLAEETARGWQIHGLEARFRALPAQIRQPHRDDSFMVVLVQAGHGSLLVDFKEVFIDGPTLVLVRPGQVHQLLTGEAGRGWVITCEPTWLPDSLAPVFHYGAHQRVADPPDPFWSLALAAAALLQQASDTLDPTRPVEFASSVLTALLHAVGRLLELPGTDSLATGRPTHLTQAFLRLLHTSPGWQRPAAYADALHVSLSHLSETVRDATGFPVSHWLHTTRVTAAKRLLYYTDLTVQQVAQQVGYDDPAYFARLFRRVAGQTAGEFRKQFRDSSKQFRSLGS